MRERFLSIGDDAWIEDDTGAKAFRVDGKALRFRDTWVLKDALGRDVATIKEKKLSIRDAVTIDLGGRHAKVKKRKIGFRERFLVEIEGGPDLKVKGNFVDHEYEIERDGHEIAEVSKRWFRIRDTYGVDVHEMGDAPLVLAVTVAVDAMTRRD